jgi:ABC-type molybdate transport system substrate-binding protein
MKTCPDCNGDGVVEKGTDDEQQCPTCGGSGFVPNDDGDQEVIHTKINVEVTPRGTGATGMVAAGDADLAVMPVSEIVHAPGVDLAGSIASEIQFVQTFSAAVVAGSGDIEGPKRLIEFLASARASETIRNSGMEPLATSR